jgi:hypothetical protein
MRVFIASSWTLGYHGGGAGQHWVKLFEGSKPDARDWYQCLAAGQRSGRLLLLNECGQAMLRRDLHGTRNRKGG